MPNTDGLSGAFEEQAELRLSWSVLGKNCQIPQSAGTAKTLWEIA
jgi:hypothetical protein